MPGLIGSQNTSLDGRKGVVLIYDLHAFSVSAGSFRARNATRGRFPGHIPGIEVVSTEVLGSSSPGERKQVRVKVFVPSAGPTVRNKVSEMLPGD